MLQMWIILEPVIFALIGTEIQINKIEPATIGYGTIVLVGALLIRFLFYYFPADVTSYIRDSPDSFPENKNSKLNLIAL